MKDKLQIHNVFTIYQFAKLFNFPSICKLTFSYIERCFTMLAETNNFLEIDYNLISNILASSGLLITTETEVFFAAKSWLRHDIKGRRKFAKDLLLKVRFPLLSYHALGHIENTSSSFIQSVTSCAMLEVLMKDSKSSVYCTNRYCNQNNFNILVCGGLSTSSIPQVFRTVTQIDVNNFKTVNVLPPMLEARSACKAVCLKGEIYVFGGFDKGLDANRNWYTSVEKYSPVTKTWIKVTDMPVNRIAYTVCKFMNKIFITGGYDEHSRRDTNSCLKFDTKDNSWEEVAGMKEARAYSACAVFDERIVVSGGHSLTTVEAYDVFGNEWSSMPNMTKRRDCHTMVVVREKLFVIGNKTCEVFDKTCRKFVPLKFPGINGYHQVVLIGEKINFFKANSSVCCYDVIENKWSQESCQATKNRAAFSCVRLYC